MFRWHRPGMCRLENQIQTLPHGKSSTYEYETQIKKTFSDENLEAVKIYKAYKP